MPFDLFLALWNCHQGLTTPAVHLRIARWLTGPVNLQNQRRLLLQAFRGCGKSTLVGLYCCWRLSQNPELRILILSADQALANKAVLQIRKILTTHPLCLGLKPHPPEQWAADRLTIVRKGASRDPSVLARGLFGNITGLRADIVICDDVEVPNTCATIQKRRDLRTRLNEVNYILTPNGTQLYIGTPHCEDSIYSLSPPAGSVDTNRSYLSEFTRLTLPVVTPNGQSQWPERFPKDRLTKMRARMGARSFDAQMMLTPQPLNTARLPPQDLRSYQIPLEILTANGQTSYRLGQEDIKQIAAWWDPAFGHQTGDKSILAIGLKDKEDNVYIDTLHALCAHEGNTDPASAQCQQIAAFIQRYQLKAIHVEINGIGRFLPGLLRQTLKAEAIRCSVVEKTSRTSKVLRILSAFEARLAARKLFVRDDILRGPDLIPEMQDWHPEHSRSHDDALDAIAGVISIFEA